MVRELCKQLRDAVSVLLRYGAGNEALIDIRKQLAARRWDYKATKPDAPPPEELEAKKALALIEPIAQQAGPMFDEHPLHRLRVGLQRVLRGDAVAFEPLWRDAEPIISQIELDVPADLRVSLKEAQDGVPNIAPGIDLPSTPRSTLYEWLAGEKTARVLGVDHRAARRAQRPLVLGLIELQNARPRR